MQTTVIYSKDKLIEFGDFQVTKNCYIISKNNLEFKNIEFNGSGVFNSEFISNNRDYTDKYNINLNDDLVKSLQLNMKGSLCMFSHNVKTDEVFIVPDPLGSAIVFYYDSPKIKIFSTTLKGIKDALSNLDIKLKKNINYFLEVSTIGNPGFTESPFEDIYSLKTFSYIKISPEGLFFTENEAIIQTIKESKNLSIEKLCDKVQQDIEENILAVSNYEADGDYYCHLTGGFDSRLIASVILKFKLQDKYYFSCSGRKGSPDKDVSLNLSKHFGLTHSSFNGNMAKKLPSSYEEEILWGLNYTNGLLSTINPNLINEDNIVLSGGYGETFRTFYSGKTDFSDYNSYKELINKIWPNINSEGVKSITSSTFESEFVKRFRDILLEGLTLGIPEESILDYIYLIIRNRYFVGQISFYHSLANSRFDPLYSLYGNLGSLMQPIEIRRNNVIGLRLLQRFSSELLRLPFDTPRLTDLFETMYGKQKLLEFNNNFKLQEYRKKTPERDNNNSRKKATADHEKKANKLNAWLYQVSEEQNAKDGLKKVLEDTDNNLVKKYLNIKFINQLINQEITNRVDLRTLHNLYKNLLWFGIK